ncbi:MAG TPA: 23S rRNA (adenine(2503)-C(2))-methyltransferase RlmN [Acidobacteriota bacterium]|nr:23S rRNA (adenine(2503)-C(2))-methyltransferase RlmN [Acidobacteriota bacterium]
MKSKNLLGLDLEELTALAVSMGERPFRGRQLYCQIYRRKQFDLSTMTDLGRSFRDRLSEMYSVQLPRVQKRTVSADGTVKFLLALQDGQLIETVYIPEVSRDTLCISSQVGCDVGCTFCMTARMGFRRNLRPGEIVGQVLLVMQEGYLPERGFNIVFMGMGEPLYNYQNVLKAFRLFVDSVGMDLSYRKVTLSTSGVVPVLEKLASEPVVPNLAISLNATTEETRHQIMPINEKWSMEELLDCCRRFPLDARRRITFEYVLLAGENDSDRDAHRLGSLLRRIPAKVNLIPFNPSPGLSHRRPSAERVEHFRSLLNKKGLAAFVRRTRGGDVSAACGQLAHLESQPLRYG